MDQFINSNVNTSYEEKSYFQRMMAPQQVDFKKLQKHQLEALGSILAPENKKVNPKIISMPTGTGKSAVLISVPFILKKTRVLIVAPNLELYKQLKDQLMGARKNADSMVLLALKMIGPTTKLPSVEAVDKTWKLDLATLRARDIVLANADKFHTGPSSEWRKLLPKNLFDLVIVDEAHHLPSKKWKVIVEHFQPCDLVFLTATPYRADGGSITAELMQPLCNGQIVYHLPLRKAIQDKLIKEPTFVNLTQEPNDPTIRVLRAVANKLLELNDNINPKEHHQGMILALDKDDAESIVQKWKDSNLDNTVRVDSYHSGRKTDRGVILNKFKKTREIKVLTVVDMLREGFDHPPISVIGIVRRVGSPLVFCQFIGRAFRIIRDKETGQPSKAHQQKAFIYTAEEFNQTRNWKAFEEEKLIDISGLDSAKQNNNNNNNNPEDCTENPQLHAMTNLNDQVDLQDQHDQQSIMEDILTSRN